MKNDGMAARLYIGDFFKEPELELLPTKNGTEANAKG